MTELDDKKRQRYRNIIKELRKIGFTVFLDVNKVNAGNKNCIIIHCAYGDASMIIHHNQMFQKD